MVSGTWSTIPTLDAEGCVVATRSVRLVQPSDLYGRTELIEVEVAAPTEQIRADAEETMNDLEEHAGRGSLFAVCRAHDEHTWWWWAYTAPGRVDQHLLELEERFPHADIRVSSDKGGAIYRERFAPSRDEQQRADDQTVLETLAAAGDDPTALRIIDHTLLFRSSTDAKTAVKRLRLAGIAARGGNRGQRRGVVVAAIESTADHGSLQLSREKLHRLCPEAFYDGWHSPAVVAGGSPGGRERRRRFGLGRSA